ncbi:MAG: hypothetical protein EP321_11320 [Sphingomonadales bacterium]|nr:MAG: hypothetical protein EP345_01685 [Sphingomonadales bacterium]TNF03163.1 MAG: hypothetical protein EP321_11320 [Sphingomonadales bacterium]
MSMRHLIAGMAVAALGVPPAFANNIGENVGWQFETTADKVNRAYLEDLRQKKKNGYYAAPVYNTYIDTQYNCSVSATATGNQSSSSAVGNSPSTTGHSASSTGNSDTISSSSGSDSSNWVTSGQSNSGDVDADASGDISTSVRGDVYQALNTDQQNSGDQLASVTGATACQFGALN